MSALGHVTDLADSLTDQSLLPPPEARNKLGGHSAEYNNSIVIALVGLIVVSVGLASLIDVCLSKKIIRIEGRPRGWVCGLLAASYALLIPGITSTLFSMNVFVHADILLLGNLSYNVTRHPITESIWSVIGTLLRTGGTLGAVLIIFYAMVVPIIKLVLLTVGELLRGSEQLHFRKISSACILVVQMTSKWASPDMFAYILLFVLCRRLNHPPLIQTTASLDVGFTCFGIFCLCSTFSSLGIGAPNAKAPGVRLLTTAEVEGMIGFSQYATKVRQHLLLLVSVLTVVFFALFLWGLASPCMTLGIDPKVLEKPKGPVPRDMVPMMDIGLVAFGLESLLHTEISLLDSIIRLAGWAIDGEITSLVAFVLLAIFTVAVTATDMLLLWAVTFASDRPGAKRASAALNFLKHISMLDVFCMGVVVVCFAGHAYKDLGVNLTLAWGIQPLIIAELLHYLVFYLVSNVVLADFNEEQLRIE